MKGISGSPVLDAYQRLAAVKGTSQVQGPAPVATAPGPGENAEVKISAKARGLAAEGDSAMDTTKVSDLKQKIASGDFKLDHAKIASRMLERFG
ncbi:MAG TPA: flagellar biosynthesis anti-sigma factor FlgM [Polyangiaceae bacterium]|nr:flagellar biosynthesis anti-sigma factor FlgM [Polyangiaceae bacterium]